MNYSLLGQQATIAILVASLGWLIVEGARWWVDERDKRKALAQKVEDLKIVLEMAEAIAKYMKEREKQGRGAISTIPNQSVFDGCVPFALDDYDQAS